MNTLVYYLPLFGLVGLLFAYIRTAWVKKQPVGSEKMAVIAKNIANGAMSFLKTEYKVLAVFIVAVAVLLFFKGENETSSNGFVALSFVIGAVFSSLAGFIGMRIATQANVRTSNAAITSLNKALAVSFAGGSVMGMAVVGLGVLGLSGLFIFYSYIGTDWTITTILNVLSGFSLGASSIALFARVGGGIFTKAADVGADLVGKVEAGIPEDHPLNPATIADNVGDNVGDVAGMGADLFESYVGSIIATMILGAGFIELDIFKTGFQLGPVLLPLFLAASGILISIFGTFFVKVSDRGNPQRALNIGELISSFLMIGTSFVLIYSLLPETWIFNGTSYSSVNIFWATIVGLITGLLVGKVTEYYTATGTAPVLSIVKQSVTGPATNIISGLGVGMMSTAIPIVLISTAIITSYWLGGLYGISIAAVGMLSNLGIQLAIDAYGPIADNAGGIAEMAELPQEVRQRTDKLDAVGNTTAAIGKGFAIASAALTALALFSAFCQQANVTFINVSEPTVIAGVLFGAMLPYVFSSLAMGAVGRAAMFMIAEVRRQFRDIPELKNALDIMKRHDGDMDKLSDEERKEFDNALTKPEYDKCVAISTQASIREMLLPGLLAIVIPPLVGFIGDATMLGGMLVGVTASGVLMAIFQSNAGGAWDNAKKMIEDCAKVDGVEYCKGSEAHKAAVVGDTVGDPFKDTSGPSLNILLKLMSIVSLIIAPSIMMTSTSQEADIAPKIKHVKVLKISEKQIMENNMIHVVRETTQVTLDGDTIVKHFETVEKPALVEPVDSLTNDSTEVKTE